MHNLNDIIANLFIYNKPTNANTIIIDNNKSEVKITNNDKQSIINQNYESIVRNQRQQICPCHKRHMNLSNEQLDSYQKSQKTILPKINMNSYFNQNNSNSRSQDFSAINKKYIRDQEELIKQIKESNESQLIQQQPFRNRTYLHIPARKRQQEEMKHNYDYNDEPKLLPRHKQHSASYINIKKLPNNIIFHKDFGKTPEYLLKKKEEYKEQKEYEKLREKEKKLPKGMTIMPEALRVAKIMELNELKKELEYELSQMPIARISMKKLLRKGEVESMLKMIDTEFTKYSLKEVIIPIETFI